MGHFICSYTLEMQECTSTVSNTICYSVFYAVSVMKPTHGRKNNEVSFLLQNIILWSWCALRTFCIICYLDQQMHTILTIMAVSYFTTQTLFLIYCAFVGLDNKLYKMHCTYIKIWEYTNSREMHLLAYRGMQYYFIQ